MTGTVSLEGSLIAALIFLWAPGLSWGLAIAKSKDYATAEVPMLPVVEGIRRSSFYKIRISRIIVILGVLGDIAWRFATGNLLHPSFVDIPTAVLIGFFLGRRPSASKPTQTKKIKMD